MRYFLSILIGSLFLILAGAPALARDRFLDIQDIKTPAGLTVWLVEDHSLPIINLQFMFRDSGTTLDPADKQGLARMLSNTMDEGAGEMDAQAFQKALADHAIDLHFSTSRDGFGGEVETLTRHQDKAFELLRLALNEPRFDDEAIARMRESNLARIRSSMTDPEWMAARIMNDRAFDGHPYGRNSGGTLSSLPKITSDDLRGFVKNLARDRLLITVAGDITAADVQKRVDAIFAKLPATTDVPAAPDTVVAHPDTTTLYEQDMPQTIIQIMMPAFGRDDPDYHALQVMNYIYGGAGFGSRLMESAREQKGLTYGIYSGIDTYRHADVLTIGTSTKNESAAEMMDIIRAEMKKMTETPVPDAELADAKSYLIGSLPLSLTSTGKISGIIMNLRAEDLPSTYLDDYAAHINAVTPADIQRVAKRILNPAVMTAVMVGKPVNVNQTIKMDTLPNVE